MNDFPEHFQIPKSPLSKLESLNRELNEKSSSFPTHIKALVEIVHSTFDFSIDKKIQMKSSVQEINDITWKTAPINYQVNLHSDRVWFSSELVGQLTYIKSNSPKVYQQKINIPWKKVCNLEYSYPPTIPLSNEKKHYEFLNPNSNRGPMEHYEQMIYTNESVFLDIVSTKIITAKEISIEHNQAYLILQINCEIMYRIFQYQVL